jgi:hypothetical protein
MHSTCSLDACGVYLCKLGRVQQRTCGMQGISLFQKGPWSTQWLAQIEPGCWQPPFSSRLLPCSMAAAAQVMQGVQSRAMVCCVLPSQRGIAIACLVCILGSGVETVVHTLPHFWVCWFGHRTQVCSVVASLSTHPKDMESFFWGNGTPPL